MIGGCAYKKARSYRRLSESGHEVGIGDYDCNRLIDVRDVVGLPVCLTGPLGRLHPGCEAFDFNADKFDDLFDLAAFQRAFSNANR